MGGSAHVRVAVVIFLLQTAVLGQSADNRMETIASALRNREFDNALQLLQPALQASQKNPQLWMFQGLAYSGKGDQKSALNSYQSALKVSPDYLPALEGAAQLQYEAGSPEAVPLLQHVLRLRPNDATSHAMLAVIAYKNNECAAAVEHFSRSESLLNSQPGALQEYGVCLLKLKQTDKAVHVFQDILASHPDDPRARRGLAAIQLTAGQPQDALSTLQPLLASDPDVSTMQLAAADHHRLADRAHFDRNSLASHSPGKQARIHWRIHDHADVLLLAEGKDVAFDLPAHYRVGRLQRSDGSNRLSPLHLAYIEIRYPDESHLAFFFQASQFGPAFLNILLRFGPVDLVQIDCIHLQPAQAILAFAADRLSLQTGSDISFLVPDSLALGEDVGLWSAALDRSRHHQLGVA